MVASCKDASWQPTAELATLVQRDQVMRSLRNYFALTGSLEVQTPVLSAAGTTDPYIDSFSVSLMGGVAASVVASNEAGAVSGTEARDNAWLHTSPEFAMKRLLAAYATDIHQFATVFRREESGKQHLREFTLLEWYRVGHRLSDLLQDALFFTNATCKVLNRPELTLQTLSYQDEVKALCGVYPHEISLSHITEVFDHNDRSFPDSLRVAVPSEADITDALALLVDEFIVKKFSTDVLTALTEYPAAQASLAKLGTHKEGHAIACRAELFLGSVELANGFEELTDGNEQKARFEKDNAARVSAGKSPVPHDEHLIDALHHGLPDCAGMALGVDRLLMVLGGYQQLSDVVSFSDANA